MRVLRSRPLWLIAVVATAVVIVLAVIGLRLLDDLLDPGDPVSGVTEVAVRDDEFDPPSILVAPGTTVTWHWEGREDQNVVGDDLESPTQSEGTYRFTFTTPGT